MLQSSFTGWIWQLGGVLKVATRATLRCTKSNSTGSRGERLPRLILAPALGSLHHPGNEIPAFHRAGDPIALHLVAAEAGEQLQRFQRLHALRNGREAER